MTQWIQGRLRGVVLGVLVFGQILMIGHQVREGGNQSRLRYWTGLMLHPLQHGVQTLLGSASSIVDGYLWTVRTGEKNRDLEARISRLQMENHFLRQDLLRLRSLEDLEAFRVQLASETLQAEVIGLGASRVAKEIVLNRGVDHGVRPGMAVTTPEGIIGKTTVVHGRSSMVLLISDSEAGAGVLLARSGEAGVLRGTGGWDCRIDYLGPHVPVSVGEFVYTSGLDGIFPRGLPVGRVSSVSQRVEAQVIRVRPFARLQNLQAVLLVLAPGHEAIPGEVQQALSASLRSGPGGVGTEPSQSSPTQADLIKQVYRSTLESQARRVGSLSASGPPDFGDAARSLRTSGSTPSAGVEGAE